MTRIFPGKVKRPAAETPEWRYALGVSALASLAIVLPFFWLGSASGHDFEFHVASWLDVAYQWREGVWYPRWAAWMNHGFGEPRYIFYPPLSWMLGAGLTRVLKLAWVPMSFVLLVQTLAGIATFFLLRKLTGLRGALFGAACYVANPNALLISYVRSDFAEQLACAIFPLLLLGALRVTNFVEEESGSARSILSFAIPFAGVWLSNAPAGVIGSYAMALLMGWAALQKKSCGIAWRGAAGIVLGFALTAFYLIPAAYEQRWVNISQALSSGLMPWENFLFTSIADVEHTWFNWIASFCAVLLMVLLGVAVLLSQTLARKGGSGENRPRELWAGLLIVGAGACALMLPFSRLLWIYLPKLRFVQFPWRWMSIVALVYACFLAVAAEKRRGWIVPVAVLLLSLPLANLLIENTWWDPDEMPTQQDAIASGKGYDGTDEYDPVGDDHLDLPVKAPHVRVLREASGGEPVKDAEVQVLKWSTERKEVRVRTRDQASVAMQVLNYPAWRVAVNGKPVLPERLDDVNEMVVPVGAGESEIQVRFTRTADRVIGNWVSGISLGICGVLFYCKRKKPTQG